MTSEQERLRAAQSERLAALTERTADRVPHRRYLEWLLEAEDLDQRHNVALPSGVSHRVADALMDDVYWCRMPLPDSGHLPPYPDAYGRYRLATARAAGARKQAEEARGRQPGTLSDLLTFDERQRRPRREEKE